MNNEDNEQKHREDKYYQEYQTLVLNMDGISDTKSWKCYLQARTHSEQENAKMRELLRKSRARSNYSTEKWNKERDELIGNEQGERG